MFTAVVPSPPYGASFCTAYRVKCSHCSISSLALSINQFVRRANPYNIRTQYEHALDETRTHEADLSRHVEHLPSHRGPGTDRLSPNMLCPRRYLQLCCWLDNIEKIYYLPSRGSCRAIYLVDYGTIEILKPKIGGPPVRTPVPFSAPTT